MKIRKIITVLIFTLATFLGFSSMHHNVSAAKYGAKIYTTPKVMRGTWHYKSGKTLNKNSSRYMHPYSKIKIGKHTITFYRKAHKGALSGRYTLYKPSNNSFKRFSSKQLLTVVNYAKKHKWLAPYNTRKTSFDFKYNWLFYYEESATGGLQLKGRTLHFSNIFFDDTYRK